jgi:type IV secretion system protein VirB10
MSNDKKNNNTSGSEQNNKTITGSIIPEVKNALSKVAGNPKKSVLALIIAVGILGFVIYKVVASHAPDKKAVEQIAKPESVSKPIDESIAKLPVIPTLPEPPVLRDPTPPPPPPTPVIPSVKTEEVKPPSVPPPPALAAVPATVPATVPVAASTDKTPALPQTNTNISSVTNFSTLLGGQDQDQMLQRKKSAIMLINGAAATSSTPAATDATTGSSSTSASFQLRSSNMEYLLTKGKVIEAVLESAVNTDFGGSSNNSFGGEVRATVLKDVYSENGKVVLVQKGSRVFGAYQTTVDTNHARVNISWTRLDLLSGYTLALDASAIDNVGRPGVRGRIDNKYAERIGAGIMGTVINVMAAKVTDKLVKPVTDTNTANSLAAQADAMVTNATAAYAKHTSGSVWTYSEVQYICSQAQSGLSDKTTTYYDELTTFCRTIQGTYPLCTTVAGCDTAALAVVTQTQTIAASMNASSTAASTPSKAQAAAQAGFEDFSNTVKTIIQSQNTTPVVTLNQGTHIKIYVNKDYEFPKSAVMKSKTIK